MRMAGEAASERDLANENIRLTTHVASRIADASTSYCASVVEAAPSVCFSNFQKIVPPEFLHIATGRLATYKTCIVVCITEYGELTRLGVPPIHYAL